MKRSIILIPLLIAIWSGIFAQNPPSVIRGEATDRQGRPLDYFNVIIQNPQDSTTLGGDCFYTASFEYRIPSTTGKAVLVCFASLGYKDRFQTVILEGESVDMGRITLEEQTIGEVVVRPRTITNSGAKTLVQVEGTALQNLATTTDILQRAPMVTATDEEVTVLGKGTPLIYIDGKISTYDAVKELQPSQIISMQVDRNPLGPL